MDQPDREVRLLEKVLGAYDKYAEKEQKKQQARNKNRKRHQPQDETRTIE